MPTGFGQQTRVLLEQFARHGHEPVLLAASVPMKPIPMKGVTEWRYANIHDVDLLDRQLHVLSPDVVFVFGCTAFISHYLKLRSAPMNCPVFYWLPYEGSVLPFTMKEEFHGTPNNTVIHLSEFAAELWEKHFQTEYIIPHAADTKIWQYDEDFGPADQKRLRRKWSERFKFPI